MGLFLIDRFFDSRTTTTTTTTTPTTTTTTIQTPPPYTGTPPPDFTIIFQTYTLPAEIQQALVQYYFYILDQKKQGIIVSENIPDFLDDLIKKYIASGELSPDLRLVIINIYLELVRRPLYAFVILNPPAWLVQIFIKYTFRAEIQYDFYVLLVKYYQDVLEQVQGGACIPDDYMPDYFAQLTQQWNDSKSITVQEQDLLVQASSEISVDVKMDVRINKAVVGYPTNLQKIFNDLQLVGIIDVRVWNVLVECVDQLVVLAVRGRLPTQYSPPADVGSALDALENEGSLSSQQRAACDAAIQQIFAYVNKNNDQNQYSYPQAISNFIDDERVMVDEVVDLLVRAYNDFDIRLINKEDIDNYTPDYYEIILNQLVCLGRITDDQKQRYLDFLIQIRIAVKASVDVINILIAYPILGPIANLTTLGYNNTDCYKILILAYNTYFQKRQSGENITGLVLDFAVTALTEIKNNGIIAEIELEAYLYCLIQIQIIVNNIFKVSEETVVFPVLIQDIIERVTVVYQVTLTIDLQKLYLTAYNLMETELEAGRSISAYTPPNFIEQLQAWANESMIIEADIVRVYIPILVEIRTRIRIDYLVKQILLKIPSYLAPIFQNLSTIQVAEVDYALINYHDYVLITFLQGNLPNQTSTDVGDAIDLAIQQGRVDASKRQLVIDAIQKIWQAVKDALDNQVLTVPDSLRVRVILKIIANYPIPPFEFIFAMIDLYIDVTNSLNNGTGQPFNTERGTYRNETDRIVSIERAPADEGQAWQSYEDEIVQCAIDDRTQKSTEITFPGEAKPFVDDFGSKGYKNQEAYASFSKEAYRLKAARLNNQPVAVSQTYKDEINVLNVSPEEKQAYLDAADKLAEEFNNTTTSP